MSSKHRIVAQISTYPLDARHAQGLLPHQIRSWSPMVDEVLITIDTHRSSSGRYCVSNFEESLDTLRATIDAVCRGNKQVRAIDVDYSESMRRAVARHFFGVDSIPIKAWDGGPFYAYFFGLYAAASQYVIHFDGDMMFGGGSKTWVQEAIACMDRRPEVLVTAPFAGPPRADGEIFGDRAQPGLTPTRESMPFPAYRHRHLSTRVFLMDLYRLKSTVGMLSSMRPSRAQRLKATLLGNPPETREAEVVLSAAMRRAGVCRIDLLGDAPGMWSLHPPYRCEEFYRRLPELVRAVEAGKVPDRQRGHYDLNDSMIDWTQARLDNHWRRRYLRMLRQRLAASA
jgi:hypothetical protein